MLLKYRCSLKEKSFLEDPPTDLEYYFYDSKLKKISKYIYDEETETFKRDPNFNFEKAIKKLPPNRMKNALWELRDQARVKQEKLQKLKESDIRVA